MTTEARGLETETPRALWARCWSPCVHVSNLAIPCGDCMEAAIKERDAAHAKEADALRTEVERLTADLSFALTVRTEAEQDRATEGAAHAEAIRVRDAREAALRDALLDVHPRNAARTDCNDRNCTKCSTCIADRALNGPPPEGLNEAIRMARAEERERCAQEMLVWHGTEAEDRIRALAPPTGAEGQPVGARPGAEPEPGVVVPCLTCKTPWARMDTVGCLPWTPAAGPTGALREPGEEIERLRAEEEKLLGEVDHWQILGEQKDAEIDRLRTALESFQLEDLTKLNANDVERIGRAIDDVLGHAHSADYLLHRASEAEVDAAIQKAGGDPAAIRARGAAFGAEILAKAAPTGALGREAPSGLTPKFDRWPGMFDPPHSLAPAEPRGLAGTDLEIVDPSGRVSYRRPAGHPDIDEARRTPGYTVRPAATPAAPQATAPTETNSSRLRRKLEDKARRHLAASGVTTACAPNCRFCAEARATLEMAPQATGAPRALCASCRAAQEGRQLHPGFPNPPCRCPAPASATPGAPEEGP